MRDTAIIIKRAIHPCNNQSFCNNVAILYESLENNGYASDLFAPRPIRPSSSFELVGRPISKVLGT